MHSEKKYWVIVGDIHDKVKNCAAIPELEGAQGIIVSGDLTNVGGIAEAWQVMQELRALKSPVWAQIGNMDRPEIDAWLTKEQCNLHRTVRELLQDTAIFGVGASIITPFRTPSEFSEDDYAIWLKDCWNKAQHYTHTILISHNPPYNTPCDQITDGSHVGSHAVREFIASQQPDVCICGHIHEARSQTKIGRTQIINPGAFADGKYALLINSEGQFSAEICSL